MAAANLTDLSPALIARYFQPQSSAGRDLFFSPPNAVTPADYAEALTAHSDGLDAPVSLYVHLPFCPVRCLNCENNTTVTHGSAQVDQYLDSLDQEIALLAAGIGENRKALQLHFGGGSPNYLSETQLVRMMEIIERHFGIDSGTDTALDANPARTSRAQLDLLRGLGFRRINFGIRDLDPTVQLAIGRMHSLEMIQDAFGAARESGFETIGMDLVYGLPSQTQQSIERTIEKIIGLAPDRVSCFSYTRRTSQFAHQHAISESLMPSLADKLAIFGSIVDGLTDSSYAWIGLDCFAKEDDPLSVAQAAGRLRRNWMGYTQFPSSDLFGFGTNAVSDLQELCVQNHTEISNWRSALAGGHFPIFRGVRLSHEERQRRNAMTALMCNMELRDYADLLEGDQQPNYLSDYARDGLLAVTPDRVSVTPHGRYLLQHIWRYHQ